MNEIKKQELASTGYENVGFNEDKGFCFILIHLFNFFY